MPLFFLMIRRPPRSTLFPTRRSSDLMDENALALFRRRTVGFVFQSFNLIPSMSALENVAFPMQFAGITPAQRNQQAGRSEEHTSELQSQSNLVCRLLLEKKNKKIVFH